MTLHEMFEDRNELVYVACAGAGAGFLQHMWNRPGSSRVLAGANLIQSHTEMDAHLGYKLGHDPSVSVEVAVDMAVSSFLKAAASALEGKKGQHPVGIGVTASVATDRPHRGQQRAEIVAINMEGARSCNVTLDRNSGQQARLMHDEQITEEIRYLLQAPQTEATCARTRLESSLVCRPVFRGYRRDFHSTGGRLYVPATLNPIHGGHMLLADHAARACGKRPRFLVTTTPAHKDPYPPWDLLYRIAKARNFTVELSFNDPLFLDKAKQRPISAFALGADSLRNLLDPQWGVPTEDVLAALNDHDTRLYIMGRVCTDGVFRKLSDIDIPAGFQHMFVELEGRIDMSSTEMREQCPV